MIKYDQIDEVEEGAHSIVEDEDRLEKKLENLAWKMNCVFVVFGIVVLAMVVRSVVMA